MTAQAEVRGRKLRRGIIILPSAFTLVNLFFGIYAIVSADRGNFIWAGWCVVFAAIMDTLDGRIARFTATGSRFGAELDSLVDAISFGVAPAFIAYRIWFSDSGWGWMLPFLFVVAVVVRLARFNIEQAGLAKTHFHGLPSPTAGMILATAYPFSQTALFEAWGWAARWPQWMAVAIVLLSALMLSHIPYPLFPRVRFGTPREIAVSLWVGFLLTLAITVPRYYFFTALSVYTLWAAGKAFLLGVLLDRHPEQDPLLEADEEDPDAEEPAQTEHRELDYGNVAPLRSARPPRPAHAPPGAHPPSEPSSSRPPASAPPASPAPPASAPPPPETPQ